MSAAWLAPGIFAGLFALVFFLILWQVRAHSVEESQVDLNRSLQSAGRTLRLLLTGNQNYLSQLAGRLSREELTREAFESQAGPYVRENAELVTILWIDETGAVQWAAPEEPNLHYLGVRWDPGVLQSLVEQSRLALSPAYTRAGPGAGGGIVFESHLPVYHSGRFAGTLCAIYSCERFLDRGIHADIVQRYQVRLVDDTGNVIAGLSASRRPDAQLTGVIGLDPPLKGMTLRLTRYGVGALGWGLAALVVVCVSLTAGLAWGMLQVSRALAERRAMESALAESEKRLDAILHSLDDIVWSFSAKTLRIIYISPAAECIYGRPLAEFNHNPRLWYEAAHSEDRDKVRLLTQSQIETDAIEMEYRIVRPDGEVRWIQSRGRTIRDEAGQPLRVDGISTDITERNKALEALWDSEERLRQSVKMQAIGRLAGGIAHDFNNLLTAILGYSEYMLSKVDEDSPLRRYVLEIHKSGERAAALTRQLLTFSRKQVTEPRLLNLNEIVADMSHLLERVIGEDIELKTESAPDLGPVKVDPGQMEQVVMNLAVNARDAMPGGGTLLIRTAHVRLDAFFVRRHEDIAPGDYVMLAVSDTGTGIDEEVLSHIFEPFYTTKPKGQGTGLGLSTVYGIVRQNGGAIEVRSRVGEGTTFQVYFPRAKGEAVNGEPSARDAMDLRGTGTVLVVEDEESVRSLIAESLRRVGYDILEAADGREALDAAASHDGPLDLVVTDIVMPNVNGIELASRLAESRPGIRILFVSGYSDSAVIHKAESSPGCAFLQKPFNPRDLARKVRALLRED